MQWKGIWNSFPPWGVHLPSSFLVRWGPFKQYMPPWARGTQSNKIQSTFNHVQFGSTPIMKWTHMQMLQKRNGPIQNFLIKLILHLVPLLVKPNHPINFQPLSPKLHPTSKLLHQQNGRFEWDDSHPKKLMWERCLLLYWWEGHPVSWKQCGMDKVNITHPIWTTPCIPFKFGTASCIHFHEMRLI